MNEKLKWVLQMDEAMALLQEACQANSEWNACYEHCPFCEYCDALMDAKLVDPLKGLDFSKELALSDDE